MEIQDKEFIVFVGPSGREKSITLRTIAYVAGFIFINQNQTGI